MSNTLRKLRLKLHRFRRLMPRRIRRLKIMSRHPFAVPVITFGLLLLLCGTVYAVAWQTDKLPTAHDAKVVIISHDKQRQIVPSEERTVGDLLKKLNIKIGQNDVVEPALNTNIDQDDFRINIYRAVPVQVVDGDQKTYVYSAAKTPRAIAQTTGSVLFPEDDITAMPSNDFLTGGAIGEQVVIERATPVNVDLYGTQVVLRTHAKTVGELVKEKNIKLAANDKLLPGPKTPIAAGQNVTFLRTGTKVETVNEAIGTPVQTINDPSLAYGTKAVRQQGSPGQQVVTYEIAITNNVETGRKVIQKVVTKAAVPQIEVMGTSLSGIKGDMARAGIAPGDYQYADYIISHESGWRPNAGSPSGPYGLCQAYPGSKMASAGADWQTNPVTQLRWCHGYAMSRYGSWAAAYNHWVASRNW